MSGDASYFVVRSRHHRQGMGAKAPAVKLDSFGDKESKQQGVCNDMWVGANAGCIQGD